MSLFYKVYFTVANFADIIKMLTTFIKKRLKKKELD